MWRRTAKSGGAVAVVLFGLWVAFAVAMRMKYAPVQSAIRRMNRAVMNPRTMETAGRPGAYASVVQHVGRTTGTGYETPVQALETDDGFVIPLPYGSSSDWLKNVLAEGAAGLVNEGHTYRVDHPEVIPVDEALPYVPRKYQWSLRLYDVDQFLRVRRVDS